MIAVTVNTVAAFNYEVKTMSDIIVNKVIKGDETYLDLTNDTVSEGALLKNRTAHNSEGIQIQGTMEDGGGSVTGVKGDDESVYRDGDVNITAANIGTYTASQIDTLLNEKVDVHGTDSLMTNAEHVKLAGIEAGAEENVIESISLNGEEITPVNKAVALSVIDKDVDDLTNYYKKSETDASLGAKQNIILSSTLSIGGQTVTEVEEALQALNENSSAKDNFIGTKQEWEALTPQEQAKYNTMDFFGDGGGGGSTGGHTIVDEEGTELTQRSKLQFNGATVSDDSENDTTVVDVEFLQNQLTDQTNVLGAKNLLKNEMVSTTVKGVTFTVNSDYSVTANGTATATIDAISNYLSFDVNKLLKVGEKYILSGCPSNGGLDSYCFVWRLNNAADPSLPYLDDGDGSEFVWKSYTGTVSLRIRIQSGYTCNNLTFKPMLRLASDPDNTYVPYAMTNRELTEVKSIAYTTESQSLYSVDTLSKVIKCGRICIASLLIKSISAESAPSGQQWTQIISGLPLSLSASNITVSPSALNHYPLQVNMNSNATSIYCRGGSVNETYRLTLVYIAN